MQIIYTELKNTLEYICSINVFDTQMLMRVSYNSRSKKRLISLTSLDESILFLKPTYITEGSRVFPNVNAELNGLSFYITLNPLSFSGENYKDWANQYQLCFVEYTPYTNLTTERFYVNKNLDGQGFDDEDTSVTPSFGDWVVTTVEVVNQDIKYFGEKTNTVDTYDSYALYPLEQALINSFYDVDMQQYAAFTSAVEQLIGFVDWVVDTANNQIVYKVPSSDPNHPTNQYIYSHSGTGIEDTTKLGLANKVCSALDFGSFQRWRDDTQLVFYCTGGGGSYAISTSVNPAYDPNAEQEQKTLPLYAVAQQIISNSTSTSIDEVLKMLSEDYINLVANSIFNTDKNKQFVKVDDLKTQLESNKTLRS